MLIENTWKASVQNVEDASASTRMLAQTTLRNILGTRTLAGILSEREEIAEEMLKILDEATDPWGKSLKSHLVLKHTESNSTYFKVSLWNVLKLKMFVFQSVFKEQWQQKLKLLVKPRPRYFLLFCWNQNIFKIILDHRSRGRNECFQEFERSSWHNCQLTSRPSIEVKFSNLVTPIKLKF